MVLGREAVVDVCYLMVEVGGEVVAEFLSGEDIGGVHSGVCQFTDDREKLFAVLCVVVDALLEGISLDGTDELVVCV
ncbi:hypothetical protein NDU88_009918 [Pleurodeles waltl]|uniref:Uncharacterized protein n=1 Tax=Pleurodeles waltl TaxID=8319 RepID=A0AAV7S2E1_PLEWA|nr:hypothetical protein NDU88_009918 [Pleurodeles waltl]